MTIAPLESGGMRLAMGYDCMPRIDTNDKASWARARALGGPNGRAMIPRRRGSGLAALWKAIRSLGMEGPIAFIVGLVWLLYIFDFSLPWYSVFPLTLLVGGGAFIIAHITYQAGSDVPEVLRD